MFDFIHLSAPPRLPADAVRAARKAAFDAAASALHLLAEAQEAGEGPRYLVVHASGKRAKATVESGVLFAATLVVGDPAAGFLNLGRTLDL